MRNSTSLGSPTGNSFQPDVSFRGFTASALLGTPQGLSVFQDGVRINEAFADVVNWDLLPKNAVASMQLLPGSNPIFGLNTLGGALTIQMKDGFGYSGLNASVSAGSFGRVEVSARRRLPRRRSRRLRRFGVDRRRRLARPLEHAHPAPLHPARRTHRPGSGESGGQPRRQLSGRHAGAPGLDARQSTAAVHVARHHGEPTRLRQRQRAACVRRRYASSRPTPTIGGSALAASTATSTTTSHRPTTRSKRPTSTPARRRKLGAPRCRARSGVSGGRRKHQLIAGLSFDAGTTDFDQSSQPATFVDDRDTDWRGPVLTGNGGENEQPLCRSLRDRHDRAVARMEPGAVRPLQLGAQSPRGTKAAKRPRSTAPAPIAASIPRPARRGPAGAARTSSAA